MQNLTPLARNLRRNETKAERFLWGRLRNRRLNGWKFRRQMPIGEYIADFCCPDAWLIVELDGGQHGAEPVTDRDRKRTIDLEDRRYLVLRFWNSEITANLDGACETILLALKGQG